MERNLTVSLKTGHQLNGHEFEKSAGDSVGQRRFSMLVHRVKQGQTQLIPKTTTQNWKYIYFFDPTILQLGNYFIKMLTQVLQDT